MVEPPVKWPTSEPTLPPVVCVGEKVRLILLPFPVSFV